MLARTIVALALVALLAAPLAFRPQADAAPSGALRVVVITPHNEQIRYEFGRAFSEWHQREHGAPVEVDFRAPGGTSEIRKLLVAIYEARLRDGSLDPDAPIDAAGPMPYDILFGGGAYEHTIVKRGVTVPLDGEPRTVSISVPLDYTEEQLEGWFGENSIGSDLLYDPDNHWFGVALTSFGIVYNKDVLRRLGLPEPQSWPDLTDHRYAGRLAMTDPRLSSSVAVTYDSILNAYGWDEGWRILRAMAANARFFANTSLKPPIEVSAGEAAAGPSIDFYGRFAAQSLLDSTDSDDPLATRVGYVDPPGVVFINADPISVLRGGANPEIARRFVDFTISERGQALWQYPAKGDEAPYEQWGPRRFELRKLPGRRVMYDEHRASFVDEDIDPFGDASTAPINGWFRIIERMFGAFAIDIHDEMRAAWDALDRAERAGLSGDRLMRLRDLFYAMPEHTFADGVTAPMSPESIQAVIDDWRNPDREPILRMAYTEFFRRQYRQVVEQAREFGVRP